MRRKTWLTLVCVGAALAVAVGISPARAGVEEVHGVAGPGAMYTIYVPDGLDGDFWNGDLVLYAHGYVRKDMPLHVPAYFDPLRDALVSMGYAVACSTYSENGYAVKEAVKQTHQLRGLFVSTFEMPDRTYVVGHSLGGIITLMLAEKYPAQYDGALPMCGQLGGTRMVAEYVAHTRVLFDYFFPGVVPGDVLSVPDGLDFEHDVAPAVTAAMIADPGSAMELAGVDQIELPVLSFNELVHCVLVVLGYNVAGAADFIDRCHGHSNFDNSATTYTGSADDTALNLGVGRFTSHPDALNYMDHFYMPDGQLRIPVLTLHTTRDPIVPFDHEAVYAGIVAAEGASDMLVQQHVERYGHCTMTGMETIQAFLDLVNWVENGVVPPSGDVTIP